MGCCGGDENNKKMKDWGSEDSQEQSSGKLNFKAIGAGLVIIVLIIYQVIVK